jgi:hypothetical protein
VVVETVDEDLRREIYLLLALSDQLAHLEHHESRETTLLH